MRPTSSTTSAARVTSDTSSRERRNWCTPTDSADVTGPGTPITTRPHRSACRPVASAPLRTPASTTTVPAVSAAMSRLRTRKRCRCGVASGGHSLTSRPSRAIRANSAAWPCG